MDKCLHISCNVIHVDKVILIRACSTFQGGFSFQLCTGCTKGFPDAYFWECVGLQSSVEERYNYWLSLVFWPVQRYLQGRNTQVVLEWKHLTSCILHDILINMKPGTGKLTRFDLHDHWFAVLISHLSDVQKIMGITIVPWPAVHEYPRATAATVHH